MNPMPRHPQPTSGDDLFDNPFTTGSDRYQPSDIQGQVDPGLDEPHLSDFVTGPSSKLLDSDAVQDLAASQARLGDALPTEGWIAEFVRYAVPVTNAPTEFHLAAALNAIAASLENRVKIRRWKQNIYPNLWTLIVAPTGNWHKTTSMTIARDLLKKAGLDVKLPDDFSREAAIEAISKKPAGLMTFGEFGSFLQTAKKDYGQGLIADFTSIYDGSDEWSRQLRSNTYTIRRPALTIYAASTKDWLQLLIQPADLRSGFFHRFLFVIAAEKNTNRKGSGDDDQVAENRLVSGLNRISKVGTTIDPGSRDANAVTIQICPNAEVLWSDWTDELDALGESGSHPDYLVGFLNRLQATALKLSMIYRVSACAFDSSADPLVIDEASMRSAIAYCQLIWGNVVHLFEEEWVTDKEGVMFQLILEKVSGRGLVWTDLLRKMRMKSALLRPYVDTLVETGQLLSVVESNASLGFDRTRLRPVEMIKPGPNHPKNLARARGKALALPKRPPNTDWEQDWDAAAADETPLFPDTLPSAA